MFGQVKEGITEVRIIVGTVWPPQHRAYVGRPLTQYGRLTGNGLKPLAKVLLDQPQCRMASSLLQRGVNFLCFSRFSCCSRMEM